MKYIDRDGNYYEESSKQDQLLSWMYHHTAGRILLKGLVHPAISKLGGRLLNTKLSAILITPFVRSNHIDLNEYIKKEYCSYNDFFTRKIRPKARPICSDKNKLISPCDGKLSAYRIDDDLKFEVKHTWYNLRTLLRNPNLAAFYQGGSCIIIRLTVDNYHRYCYVDDGQKERNHKIPGVFHTVNPVANDFVPIFKENAREYTTIHTKHFGTVTQIEVGALMVGKITNHDQEACVKRGQEKGYFEFGGSTIILLLERKKVSVDSRFFNATKDGYETVVHMGDPIGSC